MEIEVPLAPRDFRVTGDIVSSFLCPFVDGVCFLSWRVEEVLLGILDA